jgi:hypothetical protein
MMVDQWDDAEPTRLVIDAEIAKQQTNENQ